MRDFNKMFNKTLGILSAVFMFMIATILFYSLVDSKYPDLFSKDECTTVQEIN